MKDRWRGPNIYLLGVWEDNGKNGREVLFQEIIAEPINRNSK